MEVLNRAFKACDGKLFEYKKDALAHECKLGMEKSLKVLVRNWFGYEVSNYEINFVVGNIISSKDEITKILEG